MDLQGFIFSSLALLFLFFVSLQRKCRFDCRNGGVVKKKGIKHLLLLFGLVSVQYLAPMQQVLQDYGVSRPIGIVGIVDKKWTGFCDLSLQKATLIDSFGNVRRYQFVVSLPIRKDVFVGEDGVIRVLFAKTIRSKEELYLYGITAESMLADSRKP